MDNGIQDVARFGFMITGYNTNGFSNHSLAEAIEILTRIGYQSVAISLERDHLDPPDYRGVERCVEMLQPLIHATNFHVTLETGSRYILDSNHKHQPTLISQDMNKRKTRIDFLKAAVDVAAQLNANCVSLWSGRADDDADENELFDRLHASLEEVLQHAQSQKVRLAFEPEPDMLIDTMGRFEKLVSAMDHPFFGLTLDVGHVHCLNDGDVCDHIRRWKDVLWNIHIEDMKRGMHEHLMFGDGEMEFAPLFSTLKEIQYTGPIHVELSRHSHVAEVAAQQSYDFLKQFTWVC